MGIPNLAQPKSIFDLLLFRMAELYGLSGSLVTRLCEGEFGVTREEWQFIAMLAALGPLSPSELSARTIVDRSQTSKTLRCLLEKQLIFRHGVLGDGRKATVGLTKSGDEFFAEIFPRTVEINKAILADLDPQEIDVLANCLQKMDGAAKAVARSGLVAAPADRRHGGSRATWSGGESRDTLAVLQRFGSVDPGER